MSHLKLHFALHTSHCTLHTPHFTLHTPHFTLHTALLRLHTSHSTLHTSQSTLHSPHFTLLASHCFLHTSHSTLHTALFTPHTSNCTLHTPHFISSELFSPYPSSSLLICHLSFHESLPSSTTKELACVVRQPGPCVRALCEAVAVFIFEVWNQLSNTVLLGHFWSKSWFLGTLLGGTSVHLWHGAILMCVSLPDVALNLKPVTSITQ